MIIITKVLVGGFLLLESIEDIRRKSISVLGVAIFGIVAVINMLFQRNISIWELLLGFVIGAVLVLCAAVTGWIGLGDGVIFAIIGISFGGETTLRILMYGLILAAVTSALLLAVKKVRLKQEIPFIPYIMVAYLGVIICG